MTASCNAGSYELMPHSKKAMLAGPTLECRWRGNETAQSSGDRSRPAEPDAEQLAVERGRHWHSWHLNRLELPAWQRPMTSSLPSMEARATVKGLSGKISSLQASIFMPL